MSTEATWHIPTFGVGDRLRKAREDAGFANQKAFGLRIGVSRGTVQNYENGKTPVDRMKPIYLRAWSDATGVPVEWLLSGTGAVVQAGAQCDGCSIPEYLRRIGLTHRVAQILRDHGSATVTVEAQLSDPAPSSREGLHGAAGTAGPTPRDLPSHLSSRAVPVPGKSVAARAASPGAGGGPRPARAGATPS